MVYITTIRQLRQSPSFIFPKLTFIVEVTRNQETCEKNGAYKENLKNHFEFFVVSLLDGPAQLVAFIEVQRNKKQFQLIVFLPFFSLFKEYFRLVLQ